MPVGSGEVAEESRVDRACPPSSTYLPGDKEDRFQVEIRVSILSSKSVGRWGEAKRDDPKELGAARQVARGVRRATPACHLRRATRHAGLPLVPYSAVSSTLTSAPQASSLRTCMPSPVQVMGCCWGTPDPPEVAFDPVIGLSDKLKAGGVQVQGNVVSGNGSILGDSPVLQDKVTIVHLEGCLVHPLQLCRPRKYALCAPFAQPLQAYFEVTIVHSGTFAVGLATKETPLDCVMSQALATAALTRTHQPALSACRPLAKVLRCVWCDRTRRRQRGR